MSETLEVSNKCYRFFFINQIGFVARRIFSYIYSVLGPRKHSDGFYLEGLPGRTADVWHQYRYLGIRYYVFC